MVYGIEAILASIDKRVTVSSNLIDEKIVKINSNLGKLKIKRDDFMMNSKSHFKPILFIANQIFERFNYSGGVEVEIKSEIPSGVGLGSSSACCVAAAASISGLFGNLTKEEILDIAIKAEKTIFKDISGADSTVSTFGGIMKYDKKNGYSKIDSKPNFHLVIGNSNQTHSTSKIVAKVKKFKEQNSERFNHFCELESNLIKKVIEDLKNNQPHELGKAMAENQRYLEEIGVSNEKLRTMIKIVEKNCYGAKLTGAGGGGCIIAICDDSNVEKTLQSLKKENHDCFKVKIDFNGIHNF